MRIDTKALIKAAPWAAGGVAGLFLAANIATAVYIEQSLVNPRRKKNRTSELDEFVPEAQYTIEEFDYLSEGDCKISALLIHPQKPNGKVLLICHGLAHDKRSGIRFVQYLISAGYTLLLIDFRNHGQSEGRITTYGYLEKYDLICAIRTLRERGINGPIGVLGASMGASIALQAASETNEIKAMVLDSPFSSLEKIVIEHAVAMTRLPKYFIYFPLNLASLWIRCVENFDVYRVSPEESARKINCPLFLIHGSDDRRIGAHHSKQIYNALSAPGELWIVEGAGHLGAFLKHPKEYQQRVLDFFETSLS